jgi:hypothetical protein
MSVQDVILFVSSTSKHCEPTIKFIKEKEIPVKIIRLDNSEDRQNAINGKYFQIHNVPTLLVMYTDDNIQLFVGSEKIISWFRQISQKKKQVEQSKKMTAVSSEEEEEEEEERPIKYKKQKSSTIHPKKHLKKNIQKRKPVVFESSEEGEDSEDSEEEIKYYNDNIKSHPSQENKVDIKFNTNPSSEIKINGSIYDIAKKMELQREKNLGYNEKDLPTKTF